MWEKGTFEVNGSSFQYWVKRYGTGSQYGIGGGEVSKLTLKRNGKIVCNYDRGWEVRPADADAKNAVRTLLKGGNK